MSTTRTRGSGRTFRPTYRDRAGQKRVAATWAIEYYDRRERRHLKEYGFPSEAKAEQALRKRLGHQDRFGETGAGVERTKLDDLIQLVQDDYGVNRRDTTKRLVSSAAHLREAFGYDRAVDITEDRIATYSRARLEEGAAAATVNRELSLLKRGFRLAARARKVGHVPYIAMLREDNVRKGFMEPEQLRAIISHLSADLVPVVQIAALTGWRVHSEVLTREWKHVDFRGGSLRIEPGEDKSEKGRTFPLDPELRPILLAQQLLAKELGAKKDRIVPWVFFHARDLRPIRRNAFRTAWKAACLKAGVPGRLLHDLRRSAVRNLERAGVPRSVAMALVGHRTEAVYRRYAIVDEAMLREGTKLLATWREQKA